MLWWKMEQISRASNERENYSFTCYYHFLFHSHISACFLTDIERHLRLLAPGICTSEIVSAMPYRKERQTEDADGRGLFFRPLNHFSARDNDRAKFLRRRVKSRQSAVASVGVMKLDPKPVNRNTGLQRRWLFQFGAGSTRTFIQEEMSQSWLHSKTVTFSQIQHY